MAKRSVSADINRPLSVTVTGGGVAATGGGGGGGGGTLPGTITPTTGNTVTGNHHTHRMLPTHAALPDIGPADHHAPVTIGNTGLSIAGQQVSLRLATVSGLELSSGLRLADSIAGAGLTIASKVLAVGAGDGISVGADTVAVRLASPAGLSFSGGALQLDDTVAGAGLAINAKVLGIDLATNSGLELSGSPAKLHLRTPSSLDATTANTVTDVLGHTHKVTTGSARGLSASTVNAEGTGAALARADHRHAITAYSDLATYPGHLAKADTSGDSTWHKITLTDRLRTSLIDSATGTSLTIAPAQDINLSPGGTARVRATSGVRLQADNYVSQTTGWAIGYNGAADFRYVYTDELHAKAFIADLEQALAGGQIISKSVAPLSRDFTAPAAGGQTYLWVECFQGFPDAEVFQAGDVVMVRNFDRSGGGLSITNCFGTVSAPYIPSPQSDPPEQRWTFTRLSGTVNGHPAAGYMTAGQVVKRGALALDFGVSGNGYHEVNAIDGLMGENSPYDQNVKWNAHPWYDRLVVTRQGNLKGIFNVAGEYGLYAGTGVTDADKFLRISNQAIEGHNLPIKLYDGADVTISLTPGTNPYMALGKPIPTGWLSQNGFWAGRHTDGTYRQYIGQVSGGALVKGASWDGQSYNVVGNLIVGPGVGYVVDNALLHLPFDGPLPYEQDFHVDLSGHLGQKPTVASGGIIGRPGKFGKAVQLAEGTTNLVPDPVMRYLWASYGSPSVRELSTDWFVFDQTSLHVVATDIAHGGGALIGTLNSGVTYTASCWVKAVSGRASLRMYQGGSPYAFYGAQTVVAPFEGFVQFTFTMPETTSCRIVCGADGEAYFDGVQVEQKAYPTPFCYGDMGPGHAWTGTPHASTSTRTATILRYASAGLSGRRGTWAFWVATEHTAPRYWFILDARDGSNADAPLLSFIPGPKIRFYSNQSSRIEAPVTLTAGEYNHCALTYDYEDDKYYLYWNGVLVGQSTAALATPSWAPNVTVGVHYGGDGNWLNGYLDDLLILDRALTADEVRQLYTSGRPVTVTGSPHSLLLTGPGRGKVEGHAGGLFGWDGASQPCWGFCTEDGVSFGGATLNAGDVMIGDPAGGNYLQWDASAGTLTVRGDVAVTGSVSVAWSEITNKPDGARRLGTGTPGSAGLWLTGSYMGYYNGSSWPVYIANNGRFRFSADANNYVKWDGSTFEVKGRIVITGGSGVASLSDAGALATKDRAGSADVTFNYAGSTSKGGNANDTDNVSGTAASTIKSGAVRANAGLDSSGYVSRVIRGAAIAGGSAATGLNLTADYLGYYDGTAFRTYLDKNGNFLFSRPGGASLLWSASAGKLQGRDSSNNVQWETDATTGAIVAGEGTVSLSADGIVLQQTGAQFGDARLVYWKTAAGTTKFLVGMNSTATFGLLSTVEAHLYLTVAGATSDLILESQRNITLSASNVNISASGGLNLGTATGAGAGSISASGGLNLGTATGAGAGQLYLAGSSNPVVARLYHNNDDGVSLRLRVDDGSNFASIYAYDENDGGTAGYVPLYLGHANNAANSLIVNGATGRVLIGTSTDDGINRLQVSGSVVATGSMAVGSAEAFFLGDGGTNGSWRFFRSGNNLLVQRRESGSWVTKHTFTA